MYICTLAICTNTSLFFQTLRLNSCCDLHTNLFTACSGIYKEPLLAWVCGETSRFERASLVKIVLEDVGIRYFRHRYIGNKSAECWTIWQEWSTVCYRVSRWVNFACLCKPKWLTYFVVGWLQIMKPTRNFRF